MDVLRSWVDSSPKSDRLRFGQKKMPIPGGIGIFFCLALAVTYFPKASRPSIIGSVGLNYGVRNGNRCDPNDLATRNFIESLFIA